MASKVEQIEKGELALPWHFRGQADFSFLLVVTSCTLGGLVLLATPVLTKLSGGRDV